MSYTKYYTNGWADGESGNTPITAAALNHIENGIAAIGFDEGSFASSVTIPASSTLTVTIDISKSGYTPIALKGWNVGHRVLNLYYARISGNSFVATIYNSTSTDITASVYCYVIYVASAVM